MLDYQQEMKIETPRDPKDHLDVDNPEAPS